MNNDENGLSRRDLLQLAAFGAVASLGTAASQGRVAGETAARGEKAADTAGWKPGPLSADVKATPQIVDLGGVWSVVKMPLEMEGESGYAAFKQAAVESVAAHVPGEIHLDLMRAGQMDDPSVSDNARSSRWPEKHSWWYRTQFTPPEGFRQNWRQQLVFEGIDLYGQIFLNGRLIGTTRNAFSTSELDVRGLLRDGINELVVRVTSGMELIPFPTTPFPGKQKRAGLDEAYLAATYGARTFVTDEMRFLRKPAYAAYGWDFCDPLPNIGIWRGVRLQGHAGVVIHHVRLDTVIRGSEVSLTGEVVLENLHPWSEIPCVLELRLVSAQGSTFALHLQVDAIVGRFNVPCRLVVPDAQLWWPNGMGAQPLYDFTARVVCAGEETDLRAQKLGLRTVELDRSALPEGSRFCFRVNGQKVYCKGANVAPADLIPARIDAARYERLVAQARDAHFTMLRINGVGLYEGDAFYDACDRAGILVWQDFTFSCAKYPDNDPAFVSLVREEAQGVVKRLRHHASLALWCGNNESTVLMPRLWKCEPALPCGGVRLYNEVLPDICRLYDPHRPYWPGSPLGGEEPDSQTSGDTHWWSGGGLGEADKRLTQQAADTYRGRFLSEYGIVGPPHMASIRQFLKPHEVPFESTAWKIHQNVHAGAGLLAGIRSNYGDFNELTLPQFILYGQMSQALLQARVVDAMRFRKDDPADDCQGVLAWSFNDTWGETGWSIIDHYMRRKASYYWFRRSAAPVKVLVRSRNGQLVTRVVNDTLKEYRAQIRCGWFRVDGRANESREHLVTIPANGMVEVTQEPLPSPAERNPHEWLYVATLNADGVAQDQALWLLARHHELALQKPAISTTVRNGFLHVSSRVYCHGVHLQDEGQETLADNYFDLLPGISQRIRITRPTKSGNYPLAAVMPLP